MPDLITTSSADPSNPDNALPGTPLAATPSQMANSTPDNTGPQNAPPPVPSATNAPPAQSPAPQAPTTNASPAPNVSNQAATAQKPDYSNHPLNETAKLMSTVARTLAGNPQTVAIDANGNIIRKPAPLTKGQLTSAILMSALSGAIGGAAAKPGPGVLGRAAQAGFQQTLQQTEQRNQQVEERAQQDFATQQQQYVRKASLAEINGRLVLNSAQATRMGLDNMKEMISDYADRLKDYDDASAITARNVSQEQLMAGMKDGTYNATTHTAIPDGIIPGSDGKPEFTFSIIDNPAARVPFTADQTNKLAQSGAQGFIGTYGQTPATHPDMEQSGTVYTRAQGQATAVKQTADELHGIADTLAKSGDPNSKALASAIPNFNDLLKTNQGPLVSSALLRLQRHLAYDNDLTIPEELKLMASPTRPSVVDPKKQVPNEDAPFAHQLIGIIGSHDGQNDYANGLKVLDAYQKEVAPLPQIKNADDATSLMVTNPKGSRLYNAGQTWLTQNQRNEVATAGAKAGAEETARLKAKAANPGGDTDETGVSDPTLARLITPTNVGADGVNDTFLSAMQQKNPARASLIQSIGEGRTTLSKYGLSRKDGQALAADVNAAFPGYDQNKVEQYETALKDFAPGGKSGKNLVAINTALTHLQAAYDDAGWLSSTPVLSGFGSLVGNKAAGEYKTNKQALASELATAYKGGTPAEPEIREWDGILSSVNPNTLKTSLATAASRLMNRVTEIHDRWNDSVPSSFVAPTQFVTDSAANSFKHVTGSDVPTELRQKGRANPSPAPGMLPGQRVNEVPVYSSGKVIGFSLPGKSGMRAITPFTPQQQ